MPTSRQQTSRASSRTQPKLAFNSRSNKITKPSVAPPGARSLKTDVLKKEITNDEIATTETEESLEPTALSGSPQDNDSRLEHEPTTAELAIRAQVVAEPQKRTEAEDTAIEITDSQIKRYWKGKEDERKAPRVHQQGIAMNDKILREFDLSSQYGPCIGIARMKRWKRADKLGLHPPIEVLAVLLKEDAKNNVKAQRAYLDELMTSKHLND